MTTVPVHPSKLLSRPGVRARSLAARRLSEGIIRAALGFCASISIFTTIAIVVVLATETYIFFTFEQPIVETVNVNGAAQPIEAAISRENSSGIITLTGATAELLDLSARDVREGDKLYIKDAAGDVLDEVSIVGIEAHRLIVEDLPETLVGISSTIEIWRDEATVGEFLFSTEWNPLLGAEKHFGIWPLISGTLMVTLIAMFVAIPLGLMTAVYLSEYAHRRVRAILKPILEVLAGVPTVVYGFFALTIITPFLQNFSGKIDVYNMLSAGIAVGIMCLPIVCSISEDALRAVPRALREGAYGLGGTKFDVSVKVVIPGALSGIVAASLLAIARAVGETMIVTLAAGNLARIVLDPRGQGQTMTAYMVQIFLGDTSNFGIEYYSSYAVAATLFLITFIVTIIGHMIRVRFREVYQ